MNVSEYNIFKNEAFTKLWPHLNGNVFHLTSSVNADKIIEEGLIKGENIQRRTHPQSLNSYGRKRNYVCLLDMRNIEQDDIEEALFKFNFINSQYIDAPVYFILDSHSLDSLINWKVAQREVGAFEMYIPYFECWSSSSIPLTHIKEIVKVKFQWNGDIESSSESELLESLSDNELLEYIEKAKLNGYLDSLSDKEFLELKGRIRLD